MYEYLSKTWWVFAKNKFIFYGWKNLWWFWRICALSDNCCDENAQNNLSLLKYKLQCRIQSNGTAVPLAIWLAVEILLLPLLLSLSQFRLFFSRSSSVFLFCILWKKFALIPGSYRVPPPGNHVFLRKVPSQFLLLIRNFQAAIGQESCQ